MPCISRWTFVVRARLSHQQSVFYHTRSLCFAPVVTRQPPSLTFRLYERRQSSLAATEEAHEPTVDSVEAAPLADETKLNSFPLFSSLKGIISYPTFKAITVKPFQLKQMSPVQAAVFPLLPQLAEPYDPTPPPPGTSLPPRDLLVKAKTGTGKTLAFLVPVIEARIKAIEQAYRDASGMKHDKHRAMRAFVREQVGALIISPTRELATQITQEALRLTHHHDDFEVRLFVGGSSRGMQMRDWMRGRRDLVVGTPGRLLDVLRSEPDVARGMKFTKTLILDEADTLLDMGFRDDIDAITEYLPKTPERQTFLFSATVSRAIQQVARATLDKNHVFIAVESDASPVHNHVPQYHTVLPQAADQIPHLLLLLAHDQLANVGSSKCIVFLPTTKMTQLFASIMREMAPRVLPAGQRTRVYEIHSKRTQDARTNTSDGFRRDQSGASVLVTSDVSARGVDYPGVSRVIQVGIPGGTDQYIHRIGRTGRAGSKGRGDLVLLPWEVGFVTWQLAEMPLKPLTVSELKSQVQELAEKHDANPKLFFANLPNKVARRYDSSGRPLSPQRAFTFADVLAPTLNNVNQSVQELLGKLDEDAITDTFISLLGYYTGKSGELRMHDKRAIVQGCKDWAVQALGLPVPPYVSENMLHKLGISEPHHTHPSRHTNPSRPRNRWEGRGSSRSKRNSDEMGWRGGGDASRSRGRERPRASWALDKDEFEDSGQDNRMSRSRGSRDAQSGRSGYGSGPIDRGSEGFGGFRGGGSGRNGFGSGPVDRGSGGFGGFRGGGQGRTGGDRKGGGGGSRFGLRDQ